MICSDVIAISMCMCLSAADDIIRQHKTACLRITTVLACKDLLWVGTSAGVILTLAVPKISSTAIRNSFAQPTVTGKRRDSRRNLLVLVSFMGRSRFNKIAIQGTPQMAVD